MFDARELGRQVGFIHQREKQASISDNLVGAINSFRAKRPVTPEEEWLANYYYAIQSADRKYPDAGDEPSEDSDWQQHIFRTMEKRWPHKYHDNTVIY